MSHRRTINLALVIAIAACLVGLAAAPAVAAPTAAQTSADRARVDRAVKKLEATRKRSATLATRVEQTSVELDRVVAEQQRARDRLSSRALRMYRLGETSYVSVLFGATTYEQFTSRWDLLTRMNRQDAADLIELKAARAKAERSAKSMMELQAEEARAVDETEKEVARARKELAASQSALREYEARTATVAKAAAAAKKGRTTPQLGGSGAWKSGVASHYSKTFTGRGASGARIGPYSMMVAHETLPFHTLIEFEYNGKRAVASVEDRGPYSSGRSFDLGPGIVRALGFNGVHTVRYRIVKR
jgi:rare lipoprotein A (peptidoglycan hydrolase)